MLDPDGKPVKRNFVHINDLVESMVLALDYPESATTDLQYLYG